MDRAYNVLRLALLQVLMSAVCVSPCPKGISVHCPNKTGPIGEALNLTCQVTCATVSGNCINTTIQKWSINGTEIKADNYSSCFINYTFYHAIENVLAKDNGTYMFWIQMHNGYCTESFTVEVLSGPLVSARATAAGPLETASVSASGLINDEIKNHLGIWFTVAFLAFVIIAAVLYTKRKKICCSLPHQDLPHSQGTLLGTP